ncbi:MAG TPA: DUF3772 domain-containing protein [Aestuariivirga sp.]|nr:DUF3772 domain-containing protein [Aestuariivirga sp.]
MRRVCCIFAATFCALMLCLGASLAYDEAIVAQAERAAESFRAELARVEKELQLPIITDAQLAQNRTLLEDTRANSLSQAATLADPIAEVNQQISLLGPTPGNDSSEPAAVAEQRTSLENQLNRLLGAKSQLELVAVAAERLSSRASTLQRNLFLTRIFEAGPSILNPRLWIDTGLGAALMFQRLQSLYSTWWSQVSTTANFAGLILIPVFLAGFALVYRLARGKIRRWANTRLIANRSPDDIDRLWRIVRGALLAFTVLFVLFVPISLALGVGGFMTPRFQMVYSAVVEVIFVTTIYWVIARRISAPKKPAWRIVNLDDSAAARLPALVALAAFTSAATRALGKIADGLYLPFSYTIGQSAISAIIMLVLMALMLLAVASQNGLPEKTQGRIYFKWASSFVPLLWLGIATGIAALLAGYVALASFVAQQMFETAVLVTVLFLLHHLSDAAVVASTDPQSTFGRLLRHATGLGERGIARLGLLFRTLIDLLLLIAGLPLLFLLWAVTWIDFRSLANTAIFGFQVGNMTLSPSTVAVVILILLAGIVFTNLAVRWLDRRILAQTRVDKGVQDSLRKGASYTGYIVAALLAFTAAGLDFSSLALIAGALGIGIGFGLQSIVNNFVSGLILLAERPVRVGDWVVLASGEGIVKRINVRTTEIETFDSCAIIVPNSSLIAEPVKNWTYGDTIGRFVVAVTVAFDSDPEAVRGILMELSRSHPKVLTWPEPLVQLVRFSSYGLDFEIRAHVAHIYDGAMVASDLRFAILKAFAEKAITIPAPPGLIQPS